MNKVNEFGKAQLKDKITEFKAGDTLEVSVRIREGGKERTQKFEGVVMRIRGEGLNKSFTIRKVSGGIGVERIFPLHSPSVTAIKKIKSGRVRRANISYFRKLKGRAARISEKRDQ